MVRKLCQAILCSDSLFVKAVILVTLIFLVSACGPATTPAPSMTTAVPAPTRAPALLAGSGLIVFYSERDGNAEIYTMEPDGSHVRPLTHDNASVWVSAWSPDGTRIAFGSDRSGYRAIYVVNPDGIGLQQLTKNNASDDTPSWRR